MLNRTGKRKIAIALSCVLLLALGWFLVARPFSPGLPVNLQTTGAATNMGIVYLPVDAELSAYYGLSARSGALITEVAAGSPAERAGLRAGDIILSFNSVPIEEGVSLLSLIQACSPDDGVVIEVRSGQCDRNVEIDGTN